MLKLYYNPNVLPGMCIIPPNVNRVSLYTVIKRRRCFGKSNDTIFEIIILVLLGERDILFLVVTRFFIWRAMKS